MLAAMKIARLLLILLGLLLLVAIAAPLAGAYALRRYVDKDFLVQQTEKNINARVHIDDVTLTLFTWPPSLRISGFKVAPRDEFVGRPLAERPPLADAPLKVDMAYAELIPEALLQKHFLPRVIRFIGVDVQESISPDKGSSLEKLFVRPMEGVAAAGSEPDVARAIPVQPAPTVATNEPLSDVPPSTGGSAPSTQSARLALQEISIEQGRFRVSNQSADARFDGEISDFNLSITEIDIDPADLGGHNHLKVRLGAKAVLDGVAQIGGRMQQVRFADMRVNGEGNVNPIDPATMSWSPAAMLKLVIDRGSVLGGHMTIGDAAGDQLDKLMKYGIDLRGIRIGGPLQQDLAVQVLAKDQKITFLDNAHLAMPDYEVTVKRDSWLDFAKDDQGMLTRLYCGPALKEQVVRGVAARGLGETISRMVVDGFSDEQGRLAFDLTITGTLSHPQVKPDIQRRLEGLLGGDIEEKAKGLIDTFKGLKWLFKKD